MSLIASIKESRINALAAVKLIEADTRRLSSVREIAILFGLLALVAAALLTLRSLPYSTSWLERVDDEVVLRSPGDSFEVGNLTWDLTAYRTAPELQTFRDAFEPACSALKGLDAARCIIDIVKAKSPRGEPRVEFVDAQFDPSAAFREHMSGAPGHCTARSAMTATSLLAMGIPARIVQVLPLSGPGHNLIELWDAKQGWLLFDPHFDSSYLLGDSFLSALQLSQVHGGLRWRRPAEGQVDPNRFAGSTIHYPEPWLYTRVGPKCASWPFRGCFAQVGPRQFLYGDAQHVALGAFALSVLGAIAWALRLVRRQLVQ